MSSLTTAIYSTCCGVGYLALTAFLAVVLLFLFVSFVGVVSEALAAGLAGGAGRERATLPAR